MKRASRLGLAFVLHIFAGVVACGGATAFAEESEIVRDRQPTACIVLEGKPEGLLKDAAEDLRWAIREATGASLEIRNEPPAEGPLVPIRLRAAGDLKSPNTSPLPYDAGVVQVSKDGIEITGGTPLGVANAAATVLLEDFGARAYYPNALFMIVPKAASLKIRPHVARPVFDYRIWSGLAGPEAAAYSRRNRLTHSLASVPHYGFGHNLASFLSPEVYGREHPEYFAFRDGARQVKGRDVGDAVQPCFTNPDVVRLTIAAARKFFDEHPDRDTFSLCVNDNSLYCECPACSALDKPYRDLTVGRQYSESYYDYVSRVADAIAQSHPGRFLGVYAYWNVEQPPRNRQRLPDNIITALTQDILQHYDPAYRDKDHDLAKAWAGRVQRLHTYVYYGLGWITPRTSPRLVVDDLRFIAANGERAVYNEAYPFWAWSGPMHYLATRVQWDLDADTERILNEFHRDCFGDVAGEMRAYHDACERYWTHPRKARWFEGLDNLAPEEAMCDLTTLREAGEHLHAALAQAADPLVRQRIEWLTKGFELSLVIGEAFEAKRVQGSTEAKLRKLIAVMQAVEPAHERLAQDPAYGPTYYGGDRFKGKCWDFFARAIHPLADAYRKELQSSLPAGEADAKWKAFLKDSGLSALAERHKWKAF